MDKLFFSSLVFDFYLRTNTIFVINENKFSCCNSFENSIGFIQRYFFLFLCIKSTIVSRPLYKMLHTSQSFDIMGSCDVAMTFSSSSPYRIRPQPRSESTTCLKLSRGEVVPGLMKKERISPAYEAVMTRAYRYHTPTRHFSAPW